MTEIEKMYKNAGIRICKRKQGFTLKDCTGRECKECGYYEMPPFTAEKQIQLIKWLAQKEPKVEIGYSSVYGYWVENPTDTRYYFEDQFDNALANLINILWQDLTNQEKEKIKNILNENS